MIRRALQALPHLLIFALAAGCGKDSGTTPEPPIDYDAINPIVYTQHIQPIFEVSCNTSLCHNATDKALGLSLASYEDLATGSSYGAVVLPYHPERSHLLQHMNGQLQPTMPLGRDPLDPAILRLFERWIAQGAKNDDGSAMYGSVTSKAFVACQGENAVAVLDRATGRFIRLIEVGVPHSVYVDVPHRRVYVSRFENASDNIHVYDADTLELLFSGKAGTYPALMKITPDGTQLWVTNFDQVGGVAADNAVHVLDPNTLAHIATIQPPGTLQKQPHGLAIKADGSRVYVSNILTDNVSIFCTGAASCASGTDPQWLDQIPLPTIVGTTQQPQQCVLSQDGKRLFVSALGSDHLYVLNVDETDGAYGTVTGEVTVGDAPWNIALSADGQELWVANWVGKSVSVVNVANRDAPFVTDTLTPTHPSDPLRLVLLRPIGIAFSLDGSQVWVSCPNDDESGGGHHPPPAGEKKPGDVVVFDHVTHGVVSVTEVPNFARFAGFVP
jgi:DNA-binding beta-propeller fold protein YncE